MPTVDYPQATHFRGDGCLEGHGKAPAKDTLETDILWEKAFEAGRQQGLQEALEGFPKTGAVNPVNQCRAAIERLMKK